MYKTKDKTISLRLTTEEYNHIKQAAEGEDMKMSSYLRKLFKEKQEFEINLQRSLIAEKLQNLQKQ